MRPRPASAVPLKHYGHVRRRPASAVSPKHYGHMRRRPASAVSPKHYEHIRRRPASAVSLKHYEHIRPCAALSGKNSSRHAAHRPVRASTWFGGLQAHGRHNKVRCASRRAAPSNRELRLLNAAAFGHSGRNPVVASGFTRWQTLCDARARQVGFACLGATC